MSHQPSSVYYEFAVALASLVELRSTGVVAAVLGECDMCGVVPQAAAVTLHAAAV